MISNIADEYVYKKEVDWSLLMEGLTLPVENLLPKGHHLPVCFRRGAQGGSAFRSAVRAGCPGIRETDT